MYFWPVTYSDGLSGFGATGGSLLIMCNTSSQSSGGVSWWSLTIVPSCSGCERGTGRVRHRPHPRCQLPQTAAALTAEDVPGKQGRVLCCSRTGPQEGRQIHFSFKRLQTQIWLVSIMSTVHGYSYFYMLNIYFVNNCSQLIEGLFFSLCCLFLF